MKLPAKPVKHKLITDQTPLTYPTSKCVTEYLDVNFRLKLSLNNSAFRDIHKLVPLKIGKLFLTGKTFRINDVEYSIELHREEKDGFIYEPMDADVDMHGFRYEKGWYNKMMPGDVAVGDPTSFESTEYNKSRSGHRRNSLLYSVFENIFGLIKTRSEDEKLELKKTIRNGLEQLLPHYHLRNNKRRDFKGTVQLIKYTIGEEEETVMHLAEYTKPLCMTLKHILNMMFGNRKEPVSVNYMSFDGEVPVRLPVGVKFKVNHLEILQRFRDLIGPIKTIIHKSSPCLRAPSLHINTRKFSEDKRRQLAHDMAYAENRWIVREPILEEFVAKLPNNVIPNGIYIFYHCCFQNFEFKFMMDSWMRYGREENSHLEIFFQTSSTADWCFSKLQGTFRSRTTSRRVLIPTKDDKSILVIKHDVSTEYGFGKLTFGEIRNDEIGPPGPDEIMDSDESDHEDSDEDDVDEEDVADQNGVNNMGNDVSMDEEDVGNDHNNFNEDENREVLIGREGLNQRNDEPIVNEM
ncbi:unnamed protein product [Caenorhabditis nigoni]|uniref:Uncharacterized protein n=1 Tax=Caenorhabditis nigoni TaxID=1611254 RepID=A0A2G5SVS3_9PELO|nr:hypothetical protein B9Z55_024773 [Caenorhabditis nigoni]